MKTIKIIAALFFILLLATRPDSWVLWGIMAAVCIGAYWAAERSESNVGGKTVKKEIFNLDGKQS